MRVKGGQNVSRNLPKQLADVHCPLVDCSSRHCQSNVDGLSKVPCEHAALWPRPGRSLSKDRSLVRAARPGLAAAGVFSAWHF